jgi:hypothetical protein
MGLRGARGAGRKVVGKEGMVRVVGGRVAM